MFLPATTKNFDALADEVVSAHFLDDSSLQDNLVKVASRESLNPNEVQRLVEKTNTFASLRLLKTAIDKEAGLELVDYDTALSKTHPKDRAPLTKEASQTYTLPNMRKGLSLEKVAFEQLPTVEKVVKTNHIKEIFTLKKTASDLRTQKVAAELKASEGMDALLSDFSRTQGPDFQKFANEATTLYGPTCAPVLSALASSLKEPQEFTKVASLVDDSTSEHKAFATVLTSLHSIIKIAKDLTETKSKLTAAWANSKA